MALKISKETPSGVIATYWKITEIDIDLKWIHNINSHMSSHLHTNLKLSGYFDETNRRLDKTSICDYDIPITDEIQVSLESDLRPKLYQFIKTLPEWKSAENV